MNFFKQLAAQGPESDILLRIKEKNGRFTVSLTPEVANKARINPLRLTGSPDELDEGFFAEVGKALETAKGLVSNGEEFKKGIEEAAKAGAVKTEPAKPGNTKTIDNKKKTEKKPLAKKKVAADDKDDVPDIFSQQGAGSDEERPEEEENNADIDKTP